MHKIIYYVRKIVGDDYCRCFFQFTKLPPFRLINVNKIVIVEFKTSLIITHDPSSTKRYLIGFSFVWASSVIKKYLTFLNTKKRRRKKLNLLPKSSPIFEGINLEEGTKRKRQTFSVMMERNVRPKTETKLLFSQLVEKRRIVRKRKTKKRKVSRNRGPDACWMTRKKSWKRNGCQWIPRGYWKRSVVYVHWRSIIDDGRKNVCISINPANINSDVSGYMHY